MKKKRSFTYLTALVISATALMFAFLMTSVARAQSESMDKEDEEVMTLEPFEVIEPKEGEYTTQTTTVGTRSNRDLTEVIQTVNIVTQDFLQDIGAQTLTESFQYVSNTNLRNKDNSLAPGSYLMRGFGNATSFTDGAEVGNYRRDMVGYDRVEIIKGVPSAALGSGGNSGTMNYILKKPIIGYTGVKLKGIVGSYDHFRGEFDANVELGEDLAGRLIYAYTSDGEYLERMTGDGHLFYPSLRWKPSGKAEVLFNGEYLFNNIPIGSFGQGFSIYPAKFRKLFSAIGSDNDPITALNLGWDQHGNLGGSKGLQEDTSVSKVQLNYTISENLAFRQIVQHRNTDHFRRVFWHAGNNPETNPADPDNTQGIWKLVRYRWFKSTNKEFSALGDLSWETRFDLGGLELHPITQVGYRLGDLDSTGLRRAYLVREDYQWFNMANPNYEAYENHERGLEDSYTISQDTHNTSTTWSVYINQELKMLNDRLRVLYGWRNQNFDNSFVNNRTGAQTSDSGWADASIRYGGSFRITDSISFFGSFSERNDGAVTTLRYPAGLDPTDPRIGETISASASIQSRDIGIKGRLLDDRIYYSLAYFKINRTGTTNNRSLDQETPPGSGIFVVVTESFYSDGDTVDGWEFELIGDVTDRLSFLWTIGTQDARRPNRATLDDPDDTVPIRFNPDWDTNFFIKYDMKNADGNGWSVRGGVSVKGPARVYSLSSVGDVALDHTQAIGDFGVNYAFGRYSIDAIVKNVTDSTFMNVRVNRPREVRITFTADL